MKRFLIAAVMAVSTASIPATAADVGVSVSIGQPGFYGRLDIGDFPPPQVIYPQPVIIDPVQAYGSPIYLRVPPGYAKHWRKHCREYNACGERVFFVQDHWYRDEYIPRYRERHFDSRDNSDERRGEHRWEQRNENRDSNHGRDR
ncbi:MAG: hypothetical protein P4L87_20220 [Formivibrio sp.]|nr:hypothetical protein [Formivibrio sp.]